MERDVFGAAVGANGYTTVAEADRLRGYLGLEPGVRLLELGSGRGWPGLYLAGESGCDLVQTDLPVSALRESERKARRMGLTARRHGAVADGRALPFRTHSFDAVVHADVLC